MALLLSATSALAAETPAGREIVSVASVTFTIDGEPGRADSNAVRDRVQEVLGVTAVAGSGEPSPAADGERSRPVPFRLTNAGNGREAFALSVDVGAADAATAPECSRLAIDTDGDGEFGATDATYAPGSEPVLEPGASVLVFALCDIPENAADGQTAAVRLNAAAITGSGSSGAAFAGQGDEGVDAIVGATTAAVRAEAGLIVELGRPELVKAHTIQDVDGGARVRPGAVVTYTLTARLAGRGVARDVVIEDPMPEGVGYVAGSLSLDGKPVSDAVDADAGRFTGTGVQIALGELAQSKDRLVSFQVRIN